MTCRAIRHDTKQESIPLLLVRRGELTPRQCDHEFKGITGDCPTCKNQIEQTDFDGSTYANAMLIRREKGFSVTYKRFGYGSDGGVEPWRVCHWSHAPGYWGESPFKNCQNPDTECHSIALQIIREHYAKQFKASLGFVIKTEPRLRRPGDPPRAYSPDLAIYGPKGERLVAVEYQRSHEAYEKFADRDELRRSENWAAVDWWFDDTQPNPDKKKQTVYTKSQAHRTHLALLSVRLYRCWIDPQTLKLQAEPGRSGDLPPNRKKRIERHIEKANLIDCSIAEAIRELEGTPEESIIKEYKQPLRPDAGLELEFLDDLTYSIERERRVAIAVLSRKERLEEQDRKHREFQQKYIEEQEALRKEQEERQKQIDEEIERHNQILQEERNRLDAEIAQQKEAAASKSLLIAGISRELYLLSMKDSIANNYFELQRHNLNQAVQKSTWIEIEAQDYTIRGQNILKTKVIPGDLISTPRGVEVYEGVEQAGYRTNRGLYDCLVGFYLKAKNYPQF